jgi:hypothetical protein
VRAVALAAALLVVAATGCRVRTEVGIDVAEDGSGVVTVAVGLDADAMARHPGLGSELRLDDLRDAGWEVTGPVGEDDGYTWVRATKAFATPADAGRVLAEVAGADGPFRDLAVTRATSFARTTYGFTGTVDLGGGLEAFGDAALAAALGGEPLGEDAAAIEARLGQPLEEAFTFRVALRLPGSVTETNATVEEGGAVVWSPRLGEAAAVELQAASEVRRTSTVVLTVVAAVALLAAVAVAAGFPWRRRRRRRRAEPRHAAPEA